MTRRPNRSGRGKVAATVAGIVVATALAGAAWAETDVAIGKDGADGSKVAIAITGDARSSGGIALSVTGASSGAVAAASGTGSATSSAVAASGLGWASGNNASVSGTGNANRDSTLTTNLVPPTSDIGIVDNAALVYTASGVDSAMGTYAMMAMEAREQLGIATGVDELSEAQHDAVRTLIDAMVLNGVESATSPTVGTVNSSIDVTVDTAGALVAFATCPPTNVCSADGWDKMNEKEKRICRNNPYDCKRAKDTVADSLQWAKRRYGRNGHNDVSDAFRHCMWSALMTKRANSSFAKQMGDAHEYGDKNNPDDEEFMDLHNNSWGREAGRNGENHSDTWLANVCQHYQRNNTLRWLR